eukprot:539817-Rhodomonas_salina.1
MSNPRSWKQPRLGASDGSTARMHASIMRSMPCGQRVVRDERGANEERAWSGETSESAAGRARRASRGQQAHCGARGSSMSALHASAMTTQGSAVS